MDRVSQFALDRGSVAPEVHRQLWYEVRVANPTASEVSSGRVEIYYTSNLYMPFYCNLIEKYR